MKKIVKRLQKTPQHARGFALIIVLSAVALLVILIVGFLSSVGTERVAASRYHSSVLTRQLADTTVSLVQGQINMATTQGDDIAWTSQPGMVRTFDTGGAALRAYKLYSAPDMVADSVSITSDLPPAAWAAGTAHWTDLNAPVEVSGVKHFPILVPTNIGAASAPEGLAISGAPGATSYQAAPMPVRWLYVLRDGSAVAPSNTSGVTAVVPGTGATNPIVGRIAFWTDDETCKINVNTASEGAFWDTPRADTQQERTYGDFQPVQREYQRYAGHPAATSLSIAFPSLNAASIFSLVPRIVGGGSLSGTVVATAALIPDKERLYSSLDELIFNPDRQINTSMTRAQLDDARFVLTTHSRAPEVNLYNLPRIACWPLYNGLAAGKVTAFDRLIAFCTSLSKNPYYFQRENAADPTHDIQIPRNVQLYQYLQYLTGKAVPGYGGDFLSKYGADRDQILTEIFDYIRSTNLYDDNLAVGNQFTPGRYSNATSASAPLAGHGYVAPAVNTTNNTKGFGRSVTMSEFAIAFICNADGADTATPINSNTTANRMLANVGILGSNERCIQAIIVPELKGLSQGYTLFRPTLQIEIEGLDTLTINGKPLFPGLTKATTSMNADPTWLQASNSLGGPVDWRYAFLNTIAPYTTTVANRIKGSPARAGLPADPTYDTYNFIGEPIKITVPASPAAETMLFSSGELIVRLYSGITTPLLMQTFKIKLPGGTFPMPKLAADINYTKSVPLVQPKQVMWSFAKAGAISGTPGRLSYAAEDPGQGNLAGWRTGQFFYNTYDVIRSVIPAHGDYRIIAGLNEVPNNVFIPHRYYNDTTKMYASSLAGMGSNTFMMFDADANAKYFSAVTFPNTIRPDIYVGAAATNRPEATGDVDTGVSGFIDGPYINKPDEGTIFRNEASGLIPYYNVVASFTQVGSTFFSPNRMIPSAGMFGSLPTGVKAGIPWRTLLFRPQSTPVHYGGTSPKDSLLLDLFWMPVVEPYAISDRFSTAGKINLNYQILPFTYITRSTGIRALLKSEKVSAIPNSKVTTYKASYTPITSPGDTFRLDIDADQTLAQFTNKFSTGKVFLSSSDICDLWIVPKGSTLANMATYWSDKQLTGDNLREKIYTTLYPRLTTKSNTYTVHFRAQALKKGPATPANPAGTWTEGQDVILSEYRGSTTIERFINADDASIPDYAASASNPSATATLPTLDTFYKWRVIGTHQFAP